MFSEYWRPGESDGSARVKKNDEGGWTTSRDGPAGNRAHSVVGRRRGAGTAEIGAVGEDVDGAIADAPCRHVGDLAGFRLTVGLGHGLPGAHERVPLGPFVEGTDRGPHLSVSENADAASHRGRIVLIFGGLKLVQVLPIGPCH